MISPERYNTTSITASSLSSKPDPKKPLQELLYVVKITRAPASDSFLAYLFSIKELIINL